MKKLISILVAFAMMATLAITSAFAAGIPDDATADQIAVTKNLYVSNDITAFTGNVVISFAPGEATGSAATTAPTETVTKTITLTKDETKATIRCIPLADLPGHHNEPGKCILTGKPSAGRVIFALNY